MKYTKHLFLATMLASLVSARLAEAGSVNLVQNGSFESTTLSAPGYFSVNSGTSTASNVTGWSVACSYTYNASCSAGLPDLTLVVPSGLTTSPSSNVPYGNGMLYLAALSPDGGNFVADDGDSHYQAAFYQSITGLNPGDSYNVSFYQAAGQQEGPYASAITDFWQVGLGLSFNSGDSVYHDSATMSTPNQGFTAWQQQTVSFTATATTEVLSFIAGGGPAGEPPIALVDGISMTDTTTSGAAPEPSSLALVGIGLAGLFVARRQRRNSRV